MIADSFPACTANDGCGASRYEDGKDVPARRSITRRLSSLLLGAAREDSGGCTLDGKGIPRNNASDDRRPFTP